MKRVTDIATGKEYAVKMLNKQQIKETNKTQYVHTERNIFNLLNHPNTVKLSYTFQDPNTLCRNLFLSHVLIKKFMFWSFVLMDRLQANCKE